METGDLNSTEKAGASDTSFKRGNINFDLLKPVTESLEARRRDSTDQRHGDGQGKRGLFFRNRNPKPLSISQIISWIVLFMASSSTIIWSALYGKSFIWLLLFPILLLTMFGSVMMLALLLSRPR